jgi:hypothetical protein
MKSKKKNILRKAIRAIYSRLPWVKKERFYSQTISYLAAISFVGFHGNDAERLEAFRLYKRFQSDSKNGKLEVLEREANAVFVRCARRHQSSGGTPLMT